jgi:hypothetical protein
MSQQGPDPGIPKDPDYFSQGGTKPYISSSELWWYTFFGLNHFAVNEPLWGLAKLMTAGGLGLWWLWDLVFVSSNGAFVQKNGFPTPFHVLGQRLFGQGAISKGPAPFRQQSTYGLWALSTFLAPLGVQAIFEQNYPLFIRNMMNLMVILYTGYVVVSYIFIDGLDSLSFFGWIWLMIIGSIFLTDFPTVLLPWYNTVKVAFDPQTLMKQGIPFTSELDAYVNGFKDDVEKINSKDLATEINTKWSIGGTNKEYLEMLFTPRTSEEIAAMTAKNNINNKDAKDRQTNVWDIAYLAVLSPWLKSFMDNVAGVLEFIAERYGVPVDKIKEIMKKGFGGLSELSNAASAGGLGGVGGLGSLAAGMGGAGGLGSLATGLGGAGGLTGSLTGAIGPGGLGDMAGLGNKFQSFIPNNPAVPGSVAIYPPVGASIPVARLVPGGTPAAGPQRGGAREEGLSAESLVLGGTVVAILGAGAFKLAVDYLIPS